MSDYSATVHLKWTGPDWIWTGPGLTCWNSTLTSSDARKLPPISVWPLHPTTGATLVAWGSPLRVTEL